jgi:hypothetical protein
MVLRAFSQACDQSDLDAAMPLLDVLTHMVASSDTSQRIERRQSEHDLSIARDLLLRLRRQQTKAGAFPQPPSAAASTDQATSSRNTEQLQIGTVGDIIGIRKERAWSAWASQVPMPSAARQVDASSPRSLIAPDGAQAGRQ